MVDVWLWARQLSSLFHLQYLAARILGNSVLEAEVETVLGETREMSEVLSRLGLGKYVEVFASEEIDLETFQELEESDLRELGISTIGARRKLILLQKYILQIHSSIQ